MRPPYKLKSGQRIPSVTTILGVLAKPALIHWAWECGCNGQDYREVRDAFADIGSLTHYLILCRLKGIEPDTKEYPKQILDVTEDLLQIYLVWANKHKIEPILVETPLISERFQFGGTPDFYGLLDGARTLIDFKTTGDIYPDQFHQLAAYVQLLVEDGKEVDVVQILRIGREGDGIEERCLKSEDYSKHWQIFLACKTIYDLSKRGKK